MQCRVCSIGLNVVFNFANCLIFVLGLLDNKMLVFLHFMSIM